MVFEQDKAEFEIGDVENFTNSKDAGFSHQSLVMITMRKALENQGKEMRAGWFETKLDKNGNLLRTYNEDTRLCFIQSVKASMSAMECDIDNDTRKELNIILNELEKKKIELLNAEEQEWKLLLPIIKQKLAESGKGFIKGYFNREKRFFQLYIQEQVDAYEKILKLLTIQTSKLNFYGEVFISA